ncbi:MAG: hypothetical protein H8E41_06225 [Desulfobulbaceae bacterium]|uniref:Uncharacterized protein n=1 Tax=Candidatus Desulfobia pelagia TaxID=2841692 RepID=A0A8J6NEM6_9BACT|nr:hypothetical protein [Candidatus Desulfobia pelagia]
MSILQSPEETLASEIKRDIAERYFGFRKLIEDDELVLKDKIKHHSFILEKRISFDLVRIYVLLRNEALIKEFLQLIGLHETLFYDPYLLESPTITQRVLSGMSFNGFFRYSRFKNFILDCYENLTFHAKVYGSKISELEDEQGVIAAEIKQFYKDNDLSAILHFLQALGDPQLSSSMQGGIEVGLADGLDQKLYIPPPLPIEQVLTILPPLKPLSMIKGPLKKLIKKAYSLQPPEMMVYFDKKNISADRQKE